MTNTTTQAQNQFFDLHLKGLGYINRFREVQPKNKKSKPFCAVTIGFLRGDSDEVEYTYVDTIIRNSKVCEILKQYQDAINNRDSKVLGVLTVSDIYAEVFESNDGPKPTIKGRLIGMRQLKVNGEVVYKHQTEEAPVSEGTNEPAAQAEEPVQEAPVADENLEPEVSLDVNDPNFEARKTELKELGYEWSSDKKLWVLPTAA